MHSIAASAAARSLADGGTKAKSSDRDAAGEKTPLARVHFSKNSVMSQTRSLITGKFRNGATVSRPPRVALSTWVRQVQRGRPLTVMAHDPHMPTRQAKR